MKYYFFLLLTLNCLSASSQSGKWTWVRGAASFGSPGNYGIKGVAAPGNEPSSRYEPAYWKDLDGNFWLFGGNNGAGVTNDLWKYDPIANFWTWMNGAKANTNPAGSYGTQGIPSPNNYPQGLGYGSITWTDENGDLWLYGGISFINQMDELWRYHIATNEWTWMKGTMSNSTLVAGAMGVFDPSNTPGAVAECKSGWVYDHKLWFFGGQDLTGQTYGALWCYDINTNNWAWQSGSTATYYPGNFGTLGVSSPTNFPPAKVSYTNWKDTANNFYIFAGDPTFSSGNIGTNDVWRYSTSSNEWTWIKGSSNVNDTGTGLLYCNDDSTNTPRSRIENMSVRANNKCSNAFWTFGGFNTGGHDAHNDLWLFNPDKNAWTLVKGKTSTGGFGTFLPYDFGVQGVPNSNNLPPGRGGGAIWSDNAGAVWIFGGFATNASDDGFSNDLWKFEPDTSCFHLNLESYYFPAPPDSVTICEGDTVRINVPANLGIQISPVTNVSFDTTNHILSLIAVQQETYTIIASSPDQNSPCSYKDTFMIKINLVKPPLADFTISPLSTPLSQPTFTLTNQSSFATSYTWYDSVWNIISTDTNLVQTASQPGIFCFTLVASNSCNQSDTITKCAEVVAPDSVIVDGLFIPTAFSPNGDNNNDIFKPKFSGNLKLVYLNIYNRWGNLVFRSTDASQGWNGKIKGQNGESDVYFYLMEYTDGKGNKKKRTGDFTLIR